MGNSENSGVINFGIKEYMNQQFNRVRKNQKRNYLTISELLDIQPHEDFPFDFRHLGNLSTIQGILIVTDQNLDGKFCMDDFQHFALWIQLNLVSVQMYEFKSQLQGRSTQKLIEILQKKDKSSNSKPKKSKDKVTTGQQMVIQWFLKVLIQDGATRTINNIPYVKIECIKVIYEIFNIKMMTEMDIQSFFYLIKKSSQDLGYKILQYEENDEQEEFIAIPVCEEFVKHFLKGTLKTLNDIGYLNTFV